MQNAIKNVCGFDTELSTTGGTSDGRFIAPTGAQVVELGPLNATIHKVDECVSIADLDKLSDVYKSGAMHEEDQPSHLQIADYDICNDRCAEEYGNPCQNFCPAHVYEMVEDSERPGKTRLQLTPSNCVHCKTCDIADPYQVIRWVTPQGGEGPNYTNL